MSGGPVGMLGGGSAGAFAGSSAGGILGRKLANGVAAAGKAIEAASGTKMLPQGGLRDAAGKFVSAGAPAGRRLFDIMSKVAPALDKTSMLSSLYDQQESTPGDSFLQSLIHKTPGVLRDPLGVGTGATPGSDGTFPVEHYADNMKSVRDQLLEWLSRKKE